MLVAAGGGVVGALPVGGDLTLAMKALAPGMMVMGIIFFMGTISGAHLNPAVTLAFAVRGNFPWIRVPGYIVAQIIGGILAALFLQAVYGGILNGATEPGAGISDGTAALTEAILTLGLVSVILGTASGARNVGFNGAIAVGAYIGLVSVWGAPISGASMNPGRSFAPMLVGGEPRPLLGVPRRADRRRAGRGRLRVHPPRAADEGRRRGGPGHPRRGSDRRLIASALMGRWSGTSDGEADIAAAARVGGRVQGGVRGRARRGRTGRRHPRRGVQRRGHRLAGSQRPSTS